MDVQLRRRGRLLRCRWVWAGLGHSQLHIRCISELIDSRTSACRAKPGLSRAGSRATAKAKAVHRRYFSCPGTDITQSMASSRRVPDIPGRSWRLLRTAVLLPANPANCEVPAPRDENGYAVVPAPIIRSVVPGDAKARSCQGVHIMSIRIMRELWILHWKSV